MSLLTPVDEPRTVGHLPAQTITIRVSSGAGVGRTALSAFDSALHGAGVADFNLIRLSSVIPPGAEVLEVEPGQQLLGAHGDRLYCVYAAGYATSPGEQAWAGVAWSRRNDGSGEGLFVEHHGSTRDAVARDLRLSLGDLSERRGRDFTDEGMVLASATCVEQPVCALVLASYLRSPWGHDRG